MVMYSNKERSELLAVLPAKGKSLNSQNQTLSLTAVHGIGNYFLITISLIVSNKAYLDWTSAANTLTELK